MIHKYSFLTENFEILQEFKLNKKTLELLRDPAGKALKSNKQFLKMSREYQQKSLLNAGFKRDGQLWNQIFGGNGAHDKFATSMGIKNHIKNNGKDAVFNYKIQQAKNIYQKPVQQTQNIGINALRTGNAKQKAEYTRRYQDAVLASVERQKRLNAKPLMNTVVPPGATTLDPRSLGSGLAAAGRSAGSAIKTGATAAGKALTSDKAIRGYKYVGNKAVNLAGNVAKGAGYAVGGTALGVGALGAAALSD